MDYLLSLIVGFVLVGFIFLVVFRASRRKRSENDVQSHDDVTEREEDRE